MIQVFYDGKCGLCSKEINHYKKIAPKNIFQWIDVNDSKVNFDKQPFDKVEALKFLHVKDNNGNI